MVHIVQRPFTLKFQRTLLHSGWGALSRRTFAKVTRETWAEAMGAGILKRILKSFAFWGFVVLFVFGLLETVSSVTTSNGASVSHTNPLRVLFSSIVLGLFGSLIGWVIQRIFFRNKS